MPFESEEAAKLVVALNRLAASIQRPQLQTKMKRMRRRIYFGCGADADAGGDGGAFEVFVRLSVRFVCQVANYRATDGAH